MMPPSIAERSFYPTPGRHESDCVEDEGWALRDDILGFPEVASAPAVSYSSSTERNEDQVNRLSNMQPILGNVAALAVALIFYTWRMFNNVQERRKRVLCQRVAYMLWVMAEQAEAPCEPLMADTI
jgi:hypothetical protein